MAFLRRKIDSRLLNPGILARGVPEVGYGFIVSGTPSSASTNSPVMSSNETQAVITTM